jgi:pantoate--beta-alanine ligase
MGHLHEGHASLAARSATENNVTVVSIFVNPSQFNQTSDFDAYQRTLDTDAALLESLGVDYILAPTVKSMYPDDYQVQVDETEISKELEGAHRPGHFKGMLTVVLKLLNLAQADKAYFGEKDYQQLVLVQKMVEALFIPTQIIPCETKRAKTGLALSSRNSRLTPEQQKKAARLSELLTSSLSCDGVKIQLESEGFKVDYVTKKWGRRLAAVWFESVRLIDNVDLAEIEKDKKHAVVS